MTITKPLQFVEPQWAAPSGVRAVTTTRLGGVSASPYESLNLGDHVGDNSAAVSANRATLAGALGLPSSPVWLNQTHSINVAVLTQETLSANALINTDGAVTNARGVVCAVMTADCVPIFLANLSGTKVGLLHAGWRGLADGVIEQGIAQFAEPAEQVIAWSGPAISASHFEIGDEVKQALGGSSAAYQPAGNSGKWYANLAQLIGQRLAALGVRNYGASDYCSYRDDDLFFSHRRDQQTGRMASLIWIE